ncbi:ribbon-helix-helix protein, CopG family [Streptomyces sp. Amel2xB2]|uniref:ribbon-helix-helix protein, CopG family n=1 Tax=Streptomyces sp. Amel2xB2 TaxID=1305829 RepID=UPI000DB92BE4|nr:ribbon-helix-helix protein, CopG family [Streptomyces sp. Amel2xB2]
MTSKVLSLRMDSDLFDRLHTHAAKRGMSVQDYVVRALVRDDFDERLQTSVEETERFFASAASSVSSASSASSASSRRTAT